MRMAEANDETVLVETPGNFEDAIADMHPVDLDRYVLFCNLRGLEPNLRTLVFWIKTGRHIRDGIV